MQIWNVQKRLIKAFTFKEKMRDCIITTSKVLLKIIAIKIIETLLK